MVKKYILLLVCIILFNTANSQIISGIIKDASSKEALIGVNIILDDGSGTSTDIYGKYQLKIKDGEQKISFKYIGYETIINKISVEKDENKTLDVELYQSLEKLGTVVVSAGRFEQKIEDITVSMEVIKPKLIENKNTTDIQTVIDQIPGVNMTDGQANIRGGSGWSFGAGTRVLVMVDDMPLISGDAGQVQWKLIATENINQIEVIKGAASALYGSSALNGIINIRTAFPSQKDIDKHYLPGFTKVNMHFGLIDKPERLELNWNGEKRRAFKGIEFLHSMKIKTLDLSLGGNIFSDDGYRMGEITERKRFNINSNYRSKKIDGLSYGLNANFLFQSTGSALIWEGLDMAYIPTDSAVTLTSGDTYNIDPYITFIRGNNRHSFKTRFLKVINDNSTKGADAGQDNKSDTYYSDYQWQKKLDKYALVTTLGTTNEIVFASSDLFNGKSNRLNSAFYTQLDKKFERLNISFGARYEYFKLSTDKKYSINGDSINSFSASRPIFRTGLNFRLAKATFLRASWGQGYRFPSMAELFIATEVTEGIWVYPNARLKPENGWSAEIGLKQGVAFGKWKGFLDLAGFLMRYDDMMEFTFGKWDENKPDTINGGLTSNFFGLGFKSVNVGETQISGLELSISGQGKINNDLTINLLAGYTYMVPISLSKNSVYDSYDGAYEFTAYEGNGEYSDTSIIITDVSYANSSSNPSVLKYRYQHIAKIDAELIYKKTSIGGSLRFNDFMKNIDAVFTDKVINEGIEGFQDPIIPGINSARDKFKNGDLIVDLRFGYQFNDMLKLGLVINNLLNREYMSRPANMMPQRTFALQCMIKI